MMGRGFVHPGLLAPSKDLDTWAQGSAPWKSEWEEEKGGASLSFLILH